MIALKENKADEAVSIARRVTDFYNNIYRLCTTSNF